MAACPMNAPVEGDDPASTGLAADAPPAHRERLLGMLEGLRLACLAVWSASEKAYTRDPASFETVRTLEKCFGEIEASIGRAQDMLR